MEELMVEYLEDLIEQDPYEEFPRDLQESGNYVQRTGDKMVDQWQEKSAKGEAIDFSEAFTSPEAKAAFDKARERSRAAHKAKQPVVEKTETVEDPEEFRDDYTAGR